MKGFIEYLAIAFMGILVLILCTMVAIVLSTFFGICMAISYYSFLNFMEVLQ